MWLMIDKKWLWFILWRVTLPIFGWTSTALTFSEAPSHCEVLLRRKIDRAFVKDCLDPRMNVEINSIFCKFPFCLLTLKQLSRPLRSSVLEAEHFVLVFLLHFHFPIASVNLLHLRVTFVSQKLGQTTISSHLLQELVEPRLYLTTLDLWNEVKIVLNYPSTSCQISLYMTSTTWVTLSNFFAASSSDLRVIGGLPAAMRRFRGCECHILFII